MPGSYVRTETKRESISPPYGEGAAQKREASDAEILECTLTFDLCAYVRVHVA